MSNQPNLFMIGAPKCGTSSLANWLSSHSDVFMPDVKEPHYYNTDDKHRFYTTRHTYLGLFKHSSEYQYRLDASTWYLHSQVAVKNILKDCPEAKFVVCLRNPVDVAFSLHNHFVHRSGREHIKSFKNAWEMSDKRKQGLEINGLVTEPTHLAYKYSCRLGTQCEHLLELVPSSRVKFIIFDDLISHPEKVLYELLDFLELSRSIDLNIPHDNQAIKRRSVMINRFVRYLSQAKKRVGINVPTQAIGRILNKLNSKHKKYEIDPQVRIMLAEYFEGEIYKIFDVTGERFPKWLE